MRASARTLMHAAWLGFQPGIIGFVAGALLVRATGPWAVVVGLMVIAAATDFVKRRDARIDGRGEAKGIPWLGATLLLTASTLGGLLGGLMLGSGRPWATGTVLLMVLPSLAATALMWWTRQRYATLWA